jgi:hypothetical protein
MIRSGRSDAGKTRSPPGRATGGKAPVVAQPSHSMGHARRGRSAPDLRALRRLCGHCRGALQSHPLTHRAKKVGPVLRQERRFGRNRSTLAMRIVCPLFLPPKEAKVTCDQGFGPETSSDDPTGLDDAAHPPCGDRMRQRSPQVSACGTEGPRPGALLEHVAKKWLPVLRTKTCVTNNLEHAF